MHLFLITIRWFNGCFPVSFSISVIFMFSVSKPSESAFHYHQTYIG